MDEQNYNLEQSIAELDKLVEILTKETDSPDLTLITEKLKALQENFPESENRAEACARVLVKLSKMQTTDKDQVFTIEKVRTLYKEFPDSQAIALSYATALFNLSNNQNDINDRKETISKLEDLTLRFQNFQDIVLRYAKALANLSIKQTELEEVAETAQKIKDLYIKFNEPQDIALRYAMALVNLSLKETNLDKLNDTVSKLKKLAYNFEKNEDITLCYSEALAEIITKQQNEEEILETIDELKRLHGRFVQSEEIAVHYLTAQMDLEKNIQIEQSNLLKDIYQSLESISSIKILNMLVEILENKEQFKQNQVPSPTTNIINNIIKALDQLCFDSSIEEGKDEKEKNLLIRTLKLGTISDNISDTKYDILKAWIEHYGEDSTKINRLIKIYTLVQRIKYELGLKDEGINRKLKFGHYTSGKALQSILGKEYKEDKDPFSISGKTRLNNANYMNDPEEGVILEEILKLEKRNPLEPSSWFLMSFTSKTDDLAMWSQYGNNAEGVCIVLKKNDFARYHSLSDLSWYQKNSDKQIGHKMKSSVEIQNDNSQNESDKDKSTRGNESVQNYEDKHSTPNNDMDYLYRVAYVSGDQFDIEETELFTHEEVTRLTGLLEDLKSELRDYKNFRDQFYEKAIGDCIEEIRYLFKSVDYKYEEELRILQYANLIPDNKKIKIDYSPEFGKLYVERENPIQIEKVIFGPKFPNPEYVTPLLKLLDNDINYKKSTIKFR